MIEKAIKSVINQIYTEWELIVVDDGSTDNTKDVIEKFIKNDNRIKYYYQKNLERSVARNNGIKIARGDWICFLDSDDEYTKYHLSEFNKLIIKKQKTKAIYFSGYSYDKASNKLENYNESNTTKIEFILLNTISTPRACCHKNILIDYKFDQSLKIGEDKELWARILNKYSFFYHKKKTVIQHRHEGRSVNNNYDLDDIKVLKKIIMDNKNEISKTIKKRVLSNSYFYYSKKFTKNNTKKFIKFLILSILLDPTNVQTKYKLNLFINYFLNKQQFNKIINEVKLHFE